VEALACGAPVLASTRVPLPDLKSVAALCEPRFPLSIARQLERLLSDAPDAPQKVAARRAYAARFRWQIAAQQTLALYREFL
jgi:glycosyltransferase involved in cell wall biosynthesis